MFFFSRKKASDIGPSQEARVRVANVERDATLKKIDEARKTGKLLEDLLGSDTVTIRFFVGRGGARRG